MKREGKSEIRNPKSETNETNPKKQRRQTNADPRLPISPFRPFELVSDFPPSAVSPHRTTMLTKLLRRTGGFWTSDLFIALRDAFSFCRFLFIAMQYGCTGAGGFAILLPPVQFREGRRRHTKVIARDGEAVNHSGSECSELEPAAA